MIDTTAELAYMLDDCGVTVTLGAASTSGTLDEPDEVLLEVAQLVGAKRTVVIATGSLGGLVADAAVTVAGAPYTVRDYRAIDDGAMTRLFLGTP